MITSYGTMVLAPVSDWRAGIGTTFIIDLWFTGIIVAGLIACAIAYRSRMPAIAALAVLGGYVGLQFVQRQHALEFARQYADAHDLTAARVDAQPRPVSPFNWTVFVSDDERHRFAHINLVRQEPRRYQPGDGFIARVDSPYMPLAQAIWVQRSRYGEVDAARGREAWNSPRARLLPLVRQPNRRYDGEARRAAASGSSTCASRRPDAARYRSSTAPAATARSGMLTSAPAAGACASGRALLRSGRGKDRCWHRSRRG